ncbi:MAG TPA: hypothetical protein VLF71_00610 [Candidatus Saccharimonadales bacterium]|nr:hypothetical protein [Candidatus Saccharimonadales bacterium]
MKRPLPAALAAALKAYPRHFQARYAEQMQLTLQDILANKTGKAKAYAVCASFAELAAVGIKLNIQEWARMTKKPTVLTTGAALAMLLVATASLYAVHPLSCALPGQCQTASLYGTRLRYPRGWSAQKEQFFVTKDTRADGLIISAPQGAVRVALTQAYTDPIGADAGRPTAAGLQGKLVAQDTLPHALGVRVIKWIQYDDTTKTYVALENIISARQLTQLGLVAGKFTPLSTSPQMLFQAASSGPELSAGFNSQQPLSLAGATAWFNGKDAATAHKVLLSAAVGRF